MMNGWAAAVTGGALGIGVAIARASGVVGAPVAVINRSNLEIGAAAVSDFGQADRRAAQFQTGPAQTLEIEADAGVVAVALGPIDIPDDNAGRFLPGLIAEVDGLNMDDPLGLNSVSRLRPTRAVSPRVTPRGTRP